MNYLTFIFYIITNSFSLPISFSFLLLTQFLPPLLIFLVPHNFWVLVNLVLWCSFTDSIPLPLSPDYTFLINRRQLFSFRCLHQLLSSLQAYMLEKVSLTELTLNSSNLMSLNSLLIIVELELSICFWFGQEGAKTSCVS